MRNLGGAILGIFYYRKLVLGDFFILRLLWSCVIRVDTPLGGVPVVTSNQLRPFPGSSFDFLGDVNFWEFSFLGVLNQGVVQEILLCLRTLRNPIWSFKRKDIFAISSEMRDRRWVARKSYFSDFILSLITSSTNISFNHLVEHSLLSERHFELTKSCFKGNFEFSSLKFYYNLKLFVLLYPLLNFVKISEIHESDNFLN